MADFTRSEVLNEVSNIFRVRIDSGKDGGTLNTQQEYEQLLELASTTFLFNNGGIFYLGQIAANNLLSLANREIKLIEDTLVALDDLSHIGKPVTNTTTLSNANTTLLALDAASSIGGRPEMNRFAAQMDQFAAQLRANVVSQQNVLVRPREQARNIIQLNLARMKTIHNQLLTSVFSLRDLLDNFLSLDIPSRAAAKALRKIRANLESISKDAKSLSNVENIATSRQFLLTTLASKSAVQTVSGFSDPRELKIRTPVRPIPTGTTHLGRVVGTGIAASVTTSPGPWALPVSGPLDISVDGGTPVSLALDTILGAVLNGRNNETFNISATEDNLHVIVDPDVHEEPVSAATTSQVTLTNYVRLGFKNLGSVVSFPDNDQTDPLDLNARLITEMRELQTFASLAFSPPHRITLGAATGVDEGAIGLNSGHIGAYIKDSTGQRFEILRVISTLVCDVDARGLTPAAGVAAVRGQFSSGTGTTKFDFAPIVTTAPAASERALIGPSVKTVRFSVGPTRTVAQLISNIESEVGEYDDSAGRPSLNQHIKAQTVSEDPTRLALVNRSKLNPYMQISRNFVRAKNPPAVSVIEGDTVHVVLGFLEGELDTTDILTPAELMGAILDPTNGLSGVTAEVVVTEVFEGTALSTAHNTKDVSDATVIDFVANGVQLLDQIEIFSGAAAGVFQIDSIVGSTLTLLGPTFPSSEANLRYRIFRERVKISVTNAGLDSSIEITQGPSEFNLPTGTQYSGISRFEAINKLGDLLAFDNITVGDLLRIVGSSTETLITDVETSALVLGSGLPSNTKEVGFEIRSGASRQYKDLNDRLDTYTASPNLLGKNKFDEDIDAVDNALTLALLPGRNFASSRNQAKKILAELLSILTSAPRRSSEYSASIPVASDDLESMLAAYSVSAVIAVDSLISAFLERKYERAVDFLQRGQIVEFFNTTEETGSFAGAVMGASRTVAGDLPEISSAQFDVENMRDIATQIFDSPDADVDFSDTEDEFE